jgi:mRNA-degrading endonuclease toxin of MazEF toxin-antitoxin module
MEVVAPPEVRRGEVFLVDLNRRFGGKAGHVVLDQIRTVDQARLIRKLGRLSPPTLNHALSAL